MAGSWNVSAFVKALEASVTRVDVAVDRAVAEAAHDLEAKVKASFTEAHQAGTPTPSEPGQPPAVVTGTLRRSEKVEGPTRIGFGTYRAVVGPTVVYARIQELGGVTGRGHATTLPARPSLKPAYERFIAEQVMQRALARAVTGALTR